MLIAKGIFYETRMFNYERKMIFVIYLVSLFTEKKDRKTK